MAARRIAVLLVAVVTIALLVSTMGLFAGSAGGAGHSPNLGSTAARAPGTTAPPLRSAPGLAPLGSYGGHMTSTASVTLSRSTESSLPLGLATAQNAIASGKIPARSVFLPKAPTAGGVPSGQITAPSYPTFPAPMGLADFGVGSSGRYVYNTSSFESSMTLNSFRAYNPGYAGWQESPDWMTFQLNTVTDNTSYPGATNGSFWIQNVVHFNGTSLQFENNIWNFSNSAACLLPGTLQSYTGSVGSCFYYVYGPSFTMTYPFTLDLFNNVTQVWNGTNWVPGVYFNYTIINGSGSFSGSYDFVTWNGVIAPGQPPEFQVNGQNYNPLGYLFYDAELIFGGDGGGANVDMAALNATARLLSWNNGTKVYQNVPSAYDYGGDTGETSLGIAATYSGATESLVQGPSMLYGLWNTTNTSFGPAAQAGAISVALTSSSTPNAFFFATNNSTLLSTNNQFYQNWSYAPANASGTMTTQLPPPYANDPYWFEALANGFDPTNGSITGTFSTSFSMTANASAFYAPVYLTSDAGAAAFGATGLPGVSSTSGNVWVNDTTDALAPAFNRLNDFLFPTFMLFAELRLNTSVYLNNFTQNASSFNYDTDFNGLRHYALWTQGYFFDFGNGTFEVANTTVQGNQTLYASLHNSPLGAVEFWYTTGSMASNITTGQESYGVDLEFTLFATLADISGQSAANAVVLYDTTYTAAYDVSANGTDITGYPTWGIFVEGAGFTSIYGLSVTNGALGVYNVGLGYLFLQNLAADTMSTGIFSDGATFEYVTVDHSSATNSSFLAYIVDGLDVTFSNLNVTGSSAGVFVVFITNLTIYDVWSSQASFPVYVVYGTNAAIWNEWITGAQSGVNMFGDQSFAVYNVNLTSVSGGPQWYDLYVVTTWFNVIGFGPFFGSFPVAPVASALDFNGTFNAITSQYAGYGFLDNFSSEIAISNVTAYNGWDGVALNGTSFALLDSAFSSGNALGVDLEFALNITVAATTSEDSMGYGLWILASNNLTVYGNNFVANNGASTNGTFNAANVQAAESTTTNLSLDFAGMGNYWSDWGGSGGYAIGGVDGFNDTNPQAAFISNWLEFMEVGLPSGTSWGFWSLGVEYTTSAPLVFIPSWSLPVGNVSFVVVPPTGYTPSPSSGVVNFTGANMTQVINFAAIPYTVTFSQTGLPSGTSWTITLNGTAMSSTGSSIVFTTVQGSYAWALTVVPGYHPTGAASGTAVVNGANATISLTFVATTYTVAFSESGLLSGTTWSVTFNGNTQSGTASTINFASPNGSFSYSIPAVTGYTGPAPSGSGTATVSGAGQTISVTFTAVVPPTFRLTFSETGLVAGTSWSVTIGGTTMSSTTAWINFTEVNNSYPWTVSSVTGYTTTANATGTAVISGANYTVNVAFSAIQTKYAITFSETGLPSGTTWSVTLGGSTQSAAAGATIQFMEVNNTYAYTIGAVSGYSASVTSGSVTLSGAAKTVSVSFTASSGTSSPSGFLGLSNLDWIVIAVVIILVIAIAVALMMRGRRGSATSAPSSDSATPETDGGADYSSTTGDSPDTGGSS